MPKINIGVILAGIGLLLSTKGANAMLHGPTLHGLMRNRAAFMKIASVPVTGPQASLLPAKPAMRLTDPSGGLLGFDPLPRLNFGLDVLFGPRRVAPGSKESAIRNQADDISFLGHSFLGHSFLGHSFLGHGFLGHGRPRF